MASKELFVSTNTAFSKGPVPTALNEAGGRAFLLSDKAALAKLATTGTLGNLFYTTAEDQLNSVLTLADKVDDVYLAKVAVFSRERGFMKDMPALLAAKLSSRNPNLLKAVFSRVCDNGKMIRNFVQIIRSGRTGRKSLGTVPKKLIQNWINNASDRTLLNTVGSSPSLADVIKLTHPKPKDDARKALYGYFLDKEEIAEDCLPEIVKQFEQWKKTGEGNAPELDFRLLTASELKPEQWKQLALNASWQTLRQGLNMFKRHGVFDDEATVTALASKLGDRTAIQRAKVFPYQLLTAYTNIESDMPLKIKNGLQDALEVATANIPFYEGIIKVCPDVSSSMHSVVTGNRGTASSKVRCVDVAALVAASIQRKNPETEIMPFDTRLHSTASLNPRDSVMTNAVKLAKFGGGGTECSIPLRELNNRSAKADLVVYISDNESWADSSNYRSTGMMGEWEKFRQRNPKAKLVCIDIQHFATTQAPDRTDVLNVAGFSDTVFEVINLFLTGMLGNEHVVSEVEKVTI